jgi:concanavalin A-like lectin/glucanase superfamily protein
MLMVRWIRQLWVVVVLVAVMSPSLAAADLLESTHFRLDPDVANTFGGAGSSNDYALTDSGGEAVVSAGSSQSYMLSQGYIAQLPHSISLTVLPSGTVAYYPLDTGTGTRAYDLSANSNDGSLIGGPSWVSGQIGDGLSLNGSSQYVTIPTSSSLSQTGDLTIEAWVNLTNYTNTNEIVAKTVGSGATNTTYDLRTQASTGDLQFLGYDTALRTVTSSVPVGTGGWHQVAVTKTGGTATLYIDGLVEGQGSVGTTSSNSNDLKLGARDDLNSSNFLTGDIDEVRIYDRALSSAEINGDYAAGTSGLEFAQTMPNVTPGSSTTYATDCVVRTDAGGYDLYIQEPDLLTHSDGHTTIPAISSTIASPAAWVEGTTQGFGFTVTNGTQVEGKWGTSPNYDYAAVPSSATDFHSRDGFTQGLPETTSLQFRADTATSQKAGTYTATIIYTATLKP